MTDPTRSPKESVPSAVKVLRCLAAFEGASEPLDLAQVTSISGLPRSTTHRMLQYLEMQGFVAREGAKYVVGNLPSSSRSDASGPDLRLRRLALPHLADLYAATQTSVCLAVLDSPVMRPLELIQAEALPDPTVEAGPMIPASCTANGKAILAFSGAEPLLEVLRSGFAAPTRHSIRDQARLFTELQATARRGYSVQRDELVIGVSAIGAPVLVDGHPIAAVAVGAGSHTASLPRFVPLLQRACQRISQAILDGRALEASA